MDEITEECTGTRITFPINQDQIIFIKDRMVTKWLIRSKDDIKTARFMLKKYEVNEVGE